MLPVIFTTLFICGTAFASPLANQYFDSVLNTALRNEIRNLKLDPASIQDFQVHFEDKVIFIGKVKGNANFTKGALTGLSQARRYSECQGPYYSFGAKSVNCTIGFDNLKITYDGKMKYGKVPKVDIKGQANVTTTLLFVEVSQNQGMQASVKNFMFTQIGHLGTKFTGLGPLNKYTKFLDDGFKSHVQASVFNSVSQQFQYGLNRAVAVMPLPM